MHLPARRRALQGLDRRLAGRLLAAAMLVPIAEWLFGWPVHTPLRVPLLLHAAALGVIAGVAVATLRRRGGDPTRIPLDVWPVPLLAAALAFVVRERANVFYTADALLDGMAIIFAAHLAAMLLRRRALGQRGLADGLAHTPAVQVGDAVVALAGWLLAAAWALIALAHRHVVGPMLILAGALEVLALVVLIPEAAAGPGWLARLRHARGRRRARTSAGGTREHASGAPARQLTSLDRRPS